MFHSRHQTLLVLLLNHAVLSPLQQPCFLSGNSHLFPWPEPSQLCSCLLLLMNLAGATWMQNNEQIGEVESYLMFCPLHQKLDSSIKTVLSNFLPRAPLASTLWKVFGKTVSQLSFLSLSHYFCFGIWWFLLGLFRLSQRRNQKATEIAEMKAKKDHPNSHDEDELMSDRAWRKGRRGPGEDRWQFWSWRRLRRRCWLTWVGF